MTLDELKSKYPLFEKELEIELESTVIGFQQVKSRLSNVESLSGTKKSLVLEAIPKVTDGLKKFIDDASSGSSGRRHTAVKFLSIMDLEEVAYISLKVLFSTFFGNRTSTAENAVAIAVKIGSELQSQHKYNSFVESLSKRDRQSFITGLSKRIGIAYKVQYLRHYMSNSGYEYTHDWDRKTSSIVGLKMLDIIEATTGLISFQTQEWKKNGDDLGLSVSLHPSVIQAVDSGDESIAKLAMVYRPMIVPPKPWTSINNGGYWLDLRQPPSFIRVSRRKQLARYDGVDMPKVLEVVNTIQNTAWQINASVLAVANEISSMHNTYGLMPTAEAKEPPIRLPECDTDETAQKEWRKDMVRHYQADNVRRSKRLLTNSILKTANDYAVYEEIYFPHNIDYRGRVYHITAFGPQGNDLQKGLLKFAHGKPLGSEGAYWLAMHGANCYGLDKKPLAERVQWVADNEELICSIAENPLDTIEQWAIADSPFCFLAFCFEWADYVKSGKSDTFVSSIPVAFDGTCSGLQHFSALARDTVGAKAVNLVPSDEVQDIYRLVADKVQAIVDNDLINGTEDRIEKDEEGVEFTRLGTKTLAKIWNDFGITRSTTKRSVMTLCYSSKEYGFKQQVLEDTIRPAKLIDPDAFPHANQCAGYMAKCIWTSVGSVVVKAVEVMSWLQNVAGLLSKESAIGERVPVYWVTPLGFPVFQEYNKKEVKRLKTFISGTINIVSTLGEVMGDTNGGEVRPRLMVYSDKIDPIKQRNGVAPNFIHSMDACHLMSTVLLCNAQYGIESFALIHDSFGTHAGNAGKLYKGIREAFVKMYTENDVLRNFAECSKSMLSKKYRESFPEVPERGALDLSSVLDAKYAFC